MPKAYDPAASEVATDARGRAVCAGCGKPAKRGWVWKFGEIILATCRKPACKPVQREWYHGIDFT